MNVSDFSSYHGEACSICGGTWRYSKSHDCIPCSRERKSKQYKVKTETFTGEPCRKCGGTLRYVRSGNCKVCQKAHNKKARESVQGTRPPVGKQEDNSVMSVWLKRLWHGQVEVTQ